MRILIISQHYPPQVNGYAIQCAEVTQGLRERGHEILVVTSNNDLTIHETDEGVRKCLKYTPTEGCKSLGLGYLLRQVRRRRIFQQNRQTISRVAQEFDPEVTFIWQFDWIGIGILEVLQRMKIPVVLNIGDSIFCDLIGLLKHDPNPLWRLARRFLYNVDIRKFEIPNLIIVSEAIRSYYIQKGFDEKQMIVIHNGIDSKHIVHSPTRGGSGHRLLYAGRIHPTKGVDIAIRALALLNVRREKHFKLDIIGTGPLDYVEWLKKLGRSLGVDNDLEFRGPIERSALLGMYDSYDIVLFPSVYLEPFGLIVIEAMARGVPVIASNKGGPREIIKHMQDGVLVQPESSEAFAQAVRLLDETPALREELAKKAIQKVNERFNLQKNVSETEEVLFRIRMCNATPS